MARFLRNLIVAGSLTAAIGLGIGLGAGVGPFDPQTADAIGKRIGVNDSDGASGGGGGKTITCFWFQADGTIICS